MAGWLTIRKDDLNRAAPNEDRLPDIAVLVSGGLDSYVAYRHAVRSFFDQKVQAVYVAYGHPYQDKELKALERLRIRNLAVVHIEGLWDILHRRMEANDLGHIVPHRNVLLSVIGGMFANEVWLAALDGEQRGKESDKSPAFFAGVSALLSLTGSSFTEYGVVVKTPFAHMSKAEVVGLWLAAGRDPYDLLRTTSCYHASGDLVDGKYPLHCGRCLTCYKRWAAFALHGYDTVRFFETDPWQSEYAQEMREQIPLAAQKRDFSRFTPKRIEEHFRLMEIMQHRDNLQRL